MAKSNLIPQIAYWKFNALLYSIIISNTLARPLSYNASFSDELKPHCTDSTDWTAAFYNPNHCLDALQKLEDTDYKVHQSRDLEFLAPGAKSRTSLSAVRLPRKYTSGTCTIIIAMLSTIVEDILPGQVHQAQEYGTTDVSKFSYLWSIAAWVDRHCVNKNSYLGWCATGRNGDIGVFTVATKSEMNRILSSVLLLGNTSRSADPDLDLS
ncbi:MAG: hypothetical protein Q9171_006074 [Xanthocarpia ochracea]